MFIDPLPARDGQAVAQAASTEDRVWRKVLAAALALPHAAVHRDEFLRAALHDDCDEEQMLRVIEERPAVVVPLDVVDRLANSCTKRHLVKASGISFVAGLPGGFAMGGQIPIELAQFYWHALVMAQKMAYLYGWPDFLNDGEVDDEAETRITLLVGTMMGSRAAKHGLSQISDSFARPHDPHEPLHTLTGQLGYRVTTRVGRWIGVKITTDTFSKGIAKAIPLIGGVVSATVTVSTMWPMARRLKSHLRSLHYAERDPQPTAD